MAYGLLLENVEEDFARLQNEMRETPGRRMKKLYCKCNLARAQAFKGTTLVANWTVIFVKYSTIFSMPSTTYFLHICLLSLYHRLGKLDLLTKMRAFDCVLLVTTLTASRRSAVSWSPSLKPCSFSNCCARNLLASSCWRRTHFEGEL